MRGNRWGRQRKEGRKGGREWASRAERKENRNGTDEAGEGKKESI